MNLGERGTQAGIALIFAYGDAAGVGE